MATQALPDSAGAFNDDVRALPGLPVEILYEIFVMALHKHPKGSTNLLLVSRNVLEWLIPLIYKVIVLESGIAYPPPEVLKLHGHHVKNIWFSGYPPSFANDGTTLKVCPNVTNFALWYDPDDSTTHQILSVLPEVFDLPLKRLSIYTLSDELERQIQDVENQKSKSWCSNITHVAWGAVTPSACALFPSFPNLSHFLFGDWCSMETQAIVDEVLNNCPTLEVVIVLLGTAQSESEFFVLASLGDVVFEDVRVVVANGYFTASWTSGARGEDDLWVIAERTVKDRRKQNGGIVVPYH
ncbi:hypothetical protein BDN72DRAFT_904482 [Pluteus cervinus]|uniref:Uncharacterized protein n=1 Tax=Pluteus cervinus TaxID=181527 RepID=A0ACD3A5Q8_9AGAR|nr:hypothetical protein BDN72DRAFT_904482 [Pluteus cervinus]